jgi:branched-chain amino acid transport system substrate-binding protein
LGIALKTNRVIAGVVLITILFLSAYIFYPREEPVDVNQAFSGEVQIGVISPTDADLPKYVYMAELAESDINSYCIESGYNISFKFLTFSANGMAASALEITQNLHNTGVDLVVGGGWSSQLCVMRSYVNDNEILVISPSSTNPQEHSLQNDYIYRLCTHDFMTGEVMAEVVESLGLERVLIIERGDCWAEGVGNWFSRAYSGDVIGRVRYAAEISTFNEALDEAGSYLGDEVVGSRVGVFLIAFKETNNILAQLIHYPKLSNVTWLGAEPIVLTLDPAGLESIIENIRLISPLILPFPSDRLDTIAEDYQAEIDDVLDFYDASIYDSCMVLGHSVIAAESVNACLVRGVLPGVAEDYTGLTGPCGLDVNGDRQVFQMGLHDLSLEPIPRWDYIGCYDSNTGLVSWEDI